MFFIALANVGVGWARGYSTYKQTPIPIDTTILPYATLSSAVMTLRYGMANQHVHLMPTAAAAVVATGVHLLIGSQLGKAHYLVTHDD
jgi:hypothetical protein